MTFPSGKFLEQAAGRCAAVRQNRNRRPFETIQRAEQGDELDLRAVIFDYGMVLSGPPAPQAFEQILHITGLDAPRLNELYWAHRHAYDEGKLTGHAFWEQVRSDAGLALAPSQIEELTDWDARMWTTENAPMLEWQKRVKARGLKTAILSNMGDNVHRRMVQIFDWLSRFDVQVWSYQLRMAKPDPAIYRYVLNELAIEPCQALFVDDKVANIEAARALGMKAHLFATAERLREDLIEQELDGELPLPDADQ